MPNPARYALVGSFGVLYGCMGFCISVLASIVNAVTPQRPHNLQQAQSHHIHRSGHSSVVRKPASRHQHSSRRSTESVLSSEPPLTPGRVSPILHEGLPRVESPIEIAPMLGLDEEVVQQHDYFSDSAHYVQGRERAKVMFSPETRLPQRSIMMASDSVHASRNDDGVHPTERSPAHNSSSSGFSLHFKRSWTGRRRRASTTSSTLNSPGLDTTVDPSTTSPTSAPAVPILTAKPRPNPCKSLCPKKSKLLRNIASAPAGELTTSKNSSTKQSEKKRSPPPRTHPYEAPYYFPIPGSEAAATYIPRSYPEWNQASPTSPCQFVSSATSELHEKHITQNVLHHS